MIEIQENLLKISMGKVSKLKINIIVSLLVAVLFVTDYLTGSELAFSIFYLIPITLSTVFGNKKIGYIYSVVCSIAWITADLLAKNHYSSILIPIWNTLVRLSYFSFHTSILSSLIEANKEMHQMAQRDPLTNTANWRYFEEYSNRKIKEAVRENKTIALIYMDVDNFKEINDVLGHSIGDEVLKETAMGMNGAIRPQDIAARLGGDEFALLLYSVNKEEVKEIIQRMKGLIQEQLEKNGWKITFSIGAVVFNVLPSTIGPMIKRVDEVMYEVKRNGKDNIKIVDQFK